ncbi:MAG: hypothetical protein NC204_06365 [Candidatus Amulumruptor caecigallinarius]|nr:hypothetical protein [Candidatus Amulumruptor caecigallinarius]
MKKTFRMIGSVIMTLMIALTFSACSDDDDNNFGGDVIDPANHDPELVGQWECHEIETSGNWSTEIYSVIKFYPDGTMEVDDTENDSHYGSDHLWYRATWTTSGNRLSYRVTESNDDEDIVPGTTDSGMYSIIGNELTFEGTVYTRK